MRRARLEAIETLVRRPQPFSDWIQTKAASAAQRTAAQLWVDSVHGDDRSSGNTQASAIQTLEQMTQRLSAYIVNQPSLDVRFVSYPGIEEQFRVDLDLRQADPSGPVVNFYAPALIIDSQGTFSAVSPRAGNAPWVVTDGAIVTTGDLFKRIMVASGPRAGSRTWISKSTGPGGRRTGEWGLFDPINGGTYTPPQLGDAYQVLVAPSFVHYDRIRVISGHAHQFPLQPSVIFHDWDFAPHTSATAYAENYNAALVFTGCRFDKCDNIQIVTPAAAIASNTYIQNCCTTNQTGEMRFQDGGPNQNFIDGGVFVNSLFADTGAGVTLDFDALVDGSSSLAGGGVIAAENSGVVVVSAAGVVDGQDSGLFIAQDGGILVFAPDFFYGNPGRGWGSTAHAGTFGVDLRDSGRMRVRTPADLTVTGTNAAGDLRVGNTTSTWATFAAAGIIDDPRYDARAYVSTGRSRPA